MALIYAGIDEAGYGPLLGPLCVALSVFRIDEWTEGEPAPDLWAKLGAAVTRETRDKARIPIDDSKKLKLANSSSTRHPLFHLERGVLTFLRAAGLPPDPEPFPETDAAFFTALGLAELAEPWYGGNEIPWPVGTTSAAIGIAANSLRRAMNDAGVAMLTLQCEAIAESLFNDLVEAAGTKAAATESAIVKHLWTVWDHWSHQDGRGGVRIVCDRQGGRAHYTPMLQRAFPGASVVETHISATQSRYELSGIGTDGQPRHMHVLFLTESEKAHLPVALASMAAKLTRESYMARLNRYWQTRLPELKPTAGYRQDGWRFLEDTRSVMTEHERVAMIRRA